MKWLGVSMIILDAKKKDCPIPVIMAKKEIEKGNLPLQIIVDNQIAVFNVQKLVNSKNLQMNTLEKDGNFIITISKDGQTYENLIELQISSDEQNWVLFIKNETIGSTNEDLGKKLMDLFLYTLIEIENKPKYIIFMNGGVLVPTTFEQSIKHLQELSNCDVKIMSCGACLNFYQETIKVGEITNMYDIAEVLSSGIKVVSL